MRRLKFWQKAYLVTMFLFLVALFSGFTLVGWINQQQTLESEAEKIRSEHYFIAQSLARDFTAVTNSTMLNLASIAQAYGVMYGQEGVLLEIRDAHEVLFSNFNEFTYEDMGLPVEEGKQSWSIVSLEAGQYLAVVSNLLDDFSEYTLVYARPVEHLMDGWVQMRSTLIGGGLAVSVALAIALFFILRGLSRPLEKLAHVADQFAAGDLSARGTKRGNDEIGDLTESFNAMADSAEKNIAEISAVADQNARMAANLSHEIRTPLTAIQGYAEYLHLAELSSEEQAAALTYIIAESSRMQSISERMLQLSTLGSSNIEKTQVNIAKVMDQVFLSVQPKAEEAGVVLNFSDVDACEIFGDTVLLESLFINLFENAIRACEAGGVVTLEASVESSHNCLTIQISDTGCGMTPEQIENLGEPFYRADKARSRKEGGAGLGCALCQQIAQFHEVAMRYQSKLGEGTTVTLEFTTL